MWNTFVTNSDTVVRHLQSGVSEAAASHPLMIVACAALGLAVLLTVWAETQAREIDVLRELAESQRLIRGGR